MSAEACCTLAAVPTIWAIGAEKLISRLWKATSSPTLSVPVDHLQGADAEHRGAVRLDTRGGTRLEACW